MVTAPNPLVAGFYPDPSICRAGDDYYMVHSSFAYFPGVPIFHSKDLAHWEQIGNILDREEQLPLGNSEISQGIFAPTIRYHEGTFYMITTNVSGGGNFVVTATDPAGPWSKPYSLGWEAQGIDPSLFFDDDGKCYYVGTRPNPEGVRYNGDWEIWVQELDLAQMKLVGESMAIWKGALKDVIWPEGPHLYKIDGYYYLMHAEAGTGPEHAISVARSKELFKWFEGCPRNPIFTHRHLGMDYPIVYAGHGDLVDDGKGNWYVVMLASRRCQDHSSMGREPFIAKVEWQFGWPVINKGIGKLEDRVQIDLPEHRFDEEATGTDMIHFHGDKLDDRIVGIIKRSEDFYSLKDRPGYVRLYTRKEKISEKAASSYLGIRQREYAFLATTCVDFTPASADETAGLVLYQNHANHLKMEIVKGENGRQFHGRCFRVASYIKEKEEVLSLTPIEEDGPVEIRIRANDQKADIWFHTASQKKKAAQGVSLLPYSTEEAGGFVGCTIGMYASANGADSNGYADFAWLSFE